MSLLVTQTRASEGIKFHESYTPNLQENKVLVIGEKIQYGEAGREKWRVLFLSLMLYFNYFPTLLHPLSLHFFMTLFSINCGLELESRASAPFPFHRNSGGERNKNKAQWQFMSLIYTVFLCLTYFMENLPPSPPSDTWNIRNGWLVNGIPDKIN